MGSFVHEEFEKCSRLTKHDVPGSQLLTRQSKLGHQQLQHYCKPDFDLSLCWSFTSGNSYSYQTCPFDYCGFCDFSDFFAWRYCNINGSWSKTNYDSCIQIWRHNQSCISTPCNPCQDYFKVSVKLVTLFLCFLSTVCLLGSFALFSAFKTLQCMRVSIHKNLCIALILRFSTTALWISLQWSGFFNGCLGLRVKSVDWLCKLILFCIMYTTCASAYWTLVEGMHLAGKISVLALKNEIPCVVYTFVGWGVPFLCVFSWSIFMEFTTETCWMPYSSSHYKYILIVPILSALLINLILLLTIIVILVKKLNASYVREPHKIRKAAKAALLLAPMLGVTNLFFFIEPNDGANLHKIYIMGNAVMQHSQGIFLAIIYCFFNSEMRQVVKRYWNTPKINNGSPAKRMSFRQRKSLSPSLINQQFGKYMITEVLLGTNYQLTKIVVPIIRK